MTQIKSLLTNEDEVFQLEFLLSKLTEKLVQYVKSSDSVGDKYNPQELFRELTTSGLIETPKIGHGKNLDKIVEQVEFILDNSVKTWSLGFLDKLYASTNPIGVISDLVLSILNTNSHVFDVSPIVSVIEKKTGKEYADLFFDSPHTGGLTFSGGSWSNITSMHMAKVHLYPETKEQGNGDKRFAVFTSIHSHYSLVKAAILCGMGSLSVFKVGVDDKGQMSPEDLESKIKSSIEQGFVPIYVASTAGTTVYGSFDPIEKVAVICKKYKLWCHVDGSFGGNFIFSESLSHKLKGTELVDSVTVNPHKQLGVPATCSFLLLKDSRLFRTCNALDAPYLFHGDDDSFDLADGTLGCGRRPDALKFYLSWYFYGSQGFSDRVDHSYAIANYFASQLAARPGFELVNRFDGQVPCLQVCFFYRIGKGNCTRFISDTLHEQGKYLIDYAPYPEDTSKGEFFRAVFINPKLTTQYIDGIIEDFEKLGQVYIHNNPA